MTTATNNQPSKLKMVSLQVAWARLGIGEHTHQACVKNGTLPDPLPYNTRSVGYPEHELEQLIDACNKAASTDEMQALVKRIHSSRSPSANNFHRYAL